MRRKEPNDSNDSNSANDVSHFVTRSIGNETIALTRASGPIRQRLFRATEFIASPVSNIASPHMLTKSYWNFYRCIVSNSNAYIDCDRTARFTVAFDPAILSCFSNAEISASSALEPTRTSATTSDPNI